MTLYGNSQVTCIRPHSLIRFLGIIVGFVIGFAYWISWFWFLLNPAEILANPGGLCIAIAIGGIALFGTVRWMRLGGDSTEQLISLRGFLKSVHVIPSELARVRKVEWTGTNSSGNSKREYCYNLEDHRGEKIGQIPTALELCRDWDKFLQHLHNVAAASRRNGPEVTAPESGLADKTVDEWTSEDIQRYENQE